MTLVYQMELVYQLSLRSRMMTYGCMANLNMHRRVREMHLGRHMCIY